MYISDIVSEFYSSQEDAKSELKQLMLVKLEYGMNTDAVQGLISGATIEELSNFFGSSTALYAKKELVRLLEILTERIGVRCTVLDDDSPSMSGEGYLFEVIGVTDDITIATIGWFNDA